MDALQDFSTNGKTGLNPVSARPDEYSRKVPLVWWVLLFGTVGFTLYESLQSFLSTGRIWPVIFILVLFLLLWNSYLEMKQRADLAALPEPDTFSFEIESEDTERYSPREDTLALATRRLRQYFKLERDCGV